MSVQVSEYTQPQLDGWETILLEIAHHISLSEPQYNLINERYGTLQKILDGSNDPLLAEAHIFVQGSIRLRTTVKPPAGATGDIATIDADAIVLLPHAQGASAQAVLSAIERCFEAGVRVTAPIEPLNRGIRIVYADENPGFHIDVTPARCAPSNDATRGEGCLEVPDRKLGDWKRSSPIPYADWLQDASDRQIVFAEQQALSKRYKAFAEATQEPIPHYDEYRELNPLRAAIKLLKRQRDLWAIRTKQLPYRPISAIVTTLSTKAYLEVFAESAGGVRHFRPIEAMIEIVKRMPKFMVGGPGNYQVLNPKDPGENFAEKWNRPNGEGHKYRTAFDEWHRSAVQDILFGLQDHGSAAAFENAMHDRFGIPKTLVETAVDTLPKDWTLPGRAAGVSKNKLSLDALVGASVTAGASQSDIRPVGRLG